MKIILTDIVIQRLKPPTTGQLKVWDTKLAGFGLVVGKRSKTFTVVYGPERINKSIGRYPDLSLKDARAEAKALLAKGVSAGGRDSMPVAVAAYYEDCSARVRHNTLREYKRHLDHAPKRRLDKFGQKDIDVDNPHAVIAWKVFYNWCIKQGLTERNPFAHIPVKHGTRERVLTLEEIKVLWAYEHEPFSNLLKLLLLTGQRRGQIWRLQPDWIDNGALSFPAEVMKSGLAHTIPLGKLSKKLVKQAPFTFNSWSKAKVRCDKHTEITDWTIHDLRRTMATTHASLGTPIHIVETLLAHKSGSVSGVAAVYNRYDYMKEAQVAVDCYENYVRSLLH